MDRAIKKGNENARPDEKLRRLTIHSLRRSGASIHIMRGTPIPEVSAMLGHANVNITLTVYTHFIPKRQTDSASTLAAAIFSGQKAVSDQVDHLKDFRGKSSSFLVRMVVSFEMQMTVSKCDLENAPGEIRTHGPRIRNPVLYPTELRGHM
jgi:Phage integrase family